MYIWELRGVRIGSEEVGEVVGEIYKKIWNRFVCSFWVLSFFVVLDFSIYSFRAFFARFFVVIVGVVEDK